MIWGACLCSCVSPIGAKGLGYSLKQEKIVEVETKLNRPQRLLLSFWVTYISRML